ncbi:linoleate diol synthase precursor [Hypoxylon trugodes]|uniref:linoleate diol synthase precursor n=1 Tax=Hypoxylon trugodes TaxID=326681 RepID=UPI0021907DD5|nr:linoleate diol synthase precursor [Hypoxylon trugodes]KAI1392148.1 linoleate diol synthase precursor [Hypoxylon trugodes]
MPSKFAQALQVLSRALGPMPKYQFTPGNDDTSKETGLLQDLEHLGIDDYKTLKDVLDATVSGEQDDDTLLQERIVTLLAKLPPNSREGREATDAFINNLWDALEHPPAQLKTEKSRYREADGSYNNLNNPSMGASNTRYARTTPAKVFQGPNLPDAGLIFDSLMDRGDGTKFREHPNKISSMLFYVATIITHDIMQTDTRDQNIDLTSSYLDLSPLYGRNAEEQKAMRTFKNGLLKSDCFSSRNLLGFPPGVGVFLIMFNRFHNYVVTQLALINEAGRFTKPAPAHDGGDLEAWEKYDNDLFQTGRLITCGLYVNIILKDYVRTILNVNRSNSTWDLDPRTQETQSLFNSKPAPEATGNQVSVEFNLIYRWHSALSRRDEKWLDEEFRKQLGGIDPAKSGVGEVLGALARYRRGIPDDPVKRDFNDLHRGDDGTYSDDDLVDILTTSIEDVAGAFGANQVPSALRVIEILGITQAREWHVATLNEFRHHFGLKKHDTFEDINPDPTVAKKLMTLYDSPDSVELYPGLVSEKPKPPMPGSGLCVNVTTSRAILSDAVALVRGDRFYTTDYTPTNLTNWGYNEANFDLKVDQGQVMHKLIFRAFPFHFANNSIQAHFPFVVPSENKTIHDGLGTSELYSWEKPTRQLDPVVIKSHKAVSQVLSNNKDFYVPWGESISYLVSPPGKTFAKDFCLAGDGTANHESRSHVDRCLYQPQDWEVEIKNFFHETTKNLLKKASCELPPDPTATPKAAKEFEVDIVRDVIVPLNTRFVAEFFGLPIKTAETSPHGVYMEQELYGLLTAMFSAVFFDSDPANSFKLRTLSREGALGLENLVRLEAEANAKLGWVTSVAARLGFGKGKSHDITKEGEQYWPTLPHYGRQLLSRMIEKGRTIEDCIAGTVMPICAAGATIMSGLLSQCLDYFLGTGSQHLPELYRLAQENTPEADEILMHYMLEGIRLRGTVVVARTISPTSPAQKITDDTPCLANPSDPTNPSPIPNPSPSREASARTYTLTPNQRAIIDLVTASHDFLSFPDPEVLRLDRPLSTYLAWGLGPHKCLGENITRVALLASFKIIIGLSGLKRAPGPRGECKSLEFKEWRGQAGRSAVKGGGEEWTGLRAYMTPDQSAFAPVPTTMRVRWDKEIKGRRDGGWVKIGNK